ncbi:MAG TPA: hypothetical protein VFX21_10765, partial [Acidimicrobiia bacterium]|nr:hypothetical protein [Acidimicrobiia bacterium]
PDCTACTQPQFWASVAGPDAAKGGGNAALSDYCEYKDPTTQLQSGIASVPSVADNCPPGSNNHSEDTEEAQYFVIDKQSGSAGNLRVDLYDPAWINTVSSTSPCGSDATKAVWQMFESSSPTSLRRPSSPPGPGGLPPADIPVSCSGDQLSRHRHGGDALFNASLPDNFSPDRPPEYCAWVTGQNVPDGVLSAGEPCEPEKNAPWGPLGPETNSFPTAIPPDPNYKGDGRINNLFRQYLLDTRDTSGVTTTNPRLSLSGATTYELYPPDDTPTNPYDNEDHASAACADSYNGHANPWLAHEAKVNGIDTSYDTYHAWTRLLCSGGTSADGRWVLKVYGTPGSIAVNSFAIAASSNGARDGGSDPMVSVNAVDRLATYTNKPTASGDFYLARVVPSSVPRTLRLTLFDTGDFNCPTDTGANCPNTAEVQIQIKPANDDPLNPFKTTAGPDPGAPQLNELDGCQYTQPAADDWHNGLTAPWEIGTKDYGTLGDTEDDCKILHVKRKEWNGRYVMVEIPIPDNSGYYCDASEVRSCWLKIYYTSNDGTMAITDVSTWVATFSGNPVRIVK